MANNFKSTEVTLSNASETDIVAATSNNQIMIGLNAPGFGTNWIGLVSFFPLLFILEQFYKKNSITLRKRCLVFFGVCWLTGIIAA